MVGSSPPCTLFMNTLSFSITVSSLAAETRIQIVAESFMEGKWDELIKTVVDQRLACELAAQGYAVRDGLFGDEIGVLEEEVLTLTERGAFRSHRFSFSTSNGPVLFEKPHIFEFDCHDPRLAGEPIPSFKHLFSKSTFANAFAELMPQLSLRVGLNGSTLKIQRNEGHGQSTVDHLFDLMFETRMASQAGVSHYTTTIRGHPASEPSHV